MEDLGSLIKFLRIAPFDSNEEFLTHILVPLSENCEGCDKNLRLLLGSVFLRRTRSLLQIPEPKFETFVLNLSSEEKTQYSEIISESKRKMDESISSRSLMKAYNSIIQVILRLRIFCNNGLWSPDTASLSQLGTLDTQATNQTEIAKLTEGSIKYTCAFCSYEIDLTDITNDDDSPAWQQDMQILCPACLSQNEIHRKWCQPQGSDHRLFDATSDQMDYDTGSDYNMHNEGATKSPGSSTAQQQLIHEPSSKLLRLIDDIRQYLQTDKRFDQIYKAL